MNVNVCDGEEAEAVEGQWVERVTVSSALPCFPLFTACILSVHRSLMAFNEPLVNPASSCLRTACQTAVSERKRERVNTSTSQAPPVATCRPARKHNHPLSYHDD